MGDEKEKIQSHHEPNIDLSHFELSKTVGMGSFGRVRLCRYQKTGKPDMGNPILENPSLLIIHIIKYELLKNQ